MTGAMQPPDACNSDPGSAAAGIETASAWCLRLAEGPLSVAEDAALQAWLAAASQHRAQFDAARRAWNAAGSHIGHPHLQRLHRSAVAQAHSQQRVRQFALTAAAACVLFALGAIWWQWAPRIYQTGLGERKQISLADGSILQLDAKTQVEVRMRRARRELRLQHGRAIFDVANDPTRPFTVSADGSTVLATGTRFSVEQLPQQLRVVLYEGRVAVVDGDDSTSSKGQLDASHMLLPNQELIVEPGQIHRAYLARVDLNSTGAWQHGLLVFQEEPLEHAVARVNRYAQRTLRVDDPLAAQTRVSGVFKAGDTAAFVTGVTSAFALQAREAQDVTILESRL